MGKLEDVVKPLKEQVEILQKQIDELTGKVSSQEQVGYTKVYAEGAVDEELCISLAYTKFPTKDQAIPMLRAFPLSDRTKEEEYNRMVLLSIYGILDSTTAAEMGTHICFYVRDEDLLTSLKNKETEPGIFEKNEELFGDLVEMMELCKVPMTFEEPNKEDPLLKKTVGILVVEIAKCEKIREERNASSERDSIYTSGKQDRTSED